MPAALADDPPGRSLDVAQPNRGFWRNNIESLVLAISVAVLLKYFLVEAYKIPTGSMQPTLMGWNDGRGGGIFDRILVDKLSFHLRDPERFEVVVFQFPLDRSRHFIKRLVGMPGDHLRISRGDLWLESFDAAGRPSWQILRRPDGVQEQHWLRIPTQDGWDLGAHHQTWSSDGSSIHATQAGRATFPSDARGVRDQAEHGYPQAILNNLGRPSRRGGQHEAGDLRLALTVAPQADCTSVQITIEEGGRKHVLDIPGPSAAHGTRAALHSEDLSSVHTGSDLRLVAGRTHRLRFWNLDDRLEFEWGGQRMLSLEVPPAQRGPARVHLATVGGGADFRDIRLDRDLYYDSDSGTVSTWQIPHEHYVVLGDNTVDSADSRAWKLTMVHSPTGDFPGTITGQRLPEKNPTRLLDPEAFDAVAFTDVWGERRSYRSGAVRADSKPAPFVARHLMRGRALCVFWPWKPLKGIWRPKWIR